LNAELRLLAGDRRMRRGDVGLSLVERNVEIAFVDPRQHLTGPDTLVVADKHFMEVARDLGCDGRVVGFHISVIGRDQIAADGPVVEAVPARTSERRDRRTCH